MNVLKYKLNYLARLKTIIQLLYFYFLQNFDFKFKEFSILYRKYNFLTPKNIQFCTSYIIRIEH